MTDFTFAEPSSSRCSSTSPLNTPPFALAPLLFLSASLSFSRRIFSFSSSTSALDFSSCDIMSSISTWCWCIRRSFTAIISTRYFVRSSSVRLSVSFSRFCSFVFNSAISFKCLRPDSLLFESSLHSPPVLSSFLSILARNSSSSFSYCPLTSSRRSSISFSKSVSPFFKRTRRLSVSSSCLSSSFSSSICASTSFFCRLPMW